jgi:hypothetical protein
MHLQAATYIESLQGVAAMLAYWKEDAEKYLEKISETEKAGGNVAGMEVYYKKQLDKITVIETLVGSAHAYITAMESEMNQLKSKQVQQYTQQYSGISDHRKRICDLPASNESNHQDTMEMLYEIIERLPNPKKSVY